MKAGCHPKLRQDVTVRLLTHKKTASLLAVSAPGCHQAASDRLAQRRSIPGSGRRDSNPRQPAWKAVCHVIAARLLYSGSESTSSTYNHSYCTADIVCHILFEAVCSHHIECCSNYTPGPCTWQERQSFYSSQVLLSPVLSPAHEVVGRGVP